MAPPDRDAILERRALLLASAVAAFGSSSARADECPEIAEPTSEAKAGARRLFEQAQAARAGEDHDAALELLRRAYELAPIPGMLLPLAQGELAAGQPARALARLRTLVRCFPDAPRAADAASLLARLEQEVGWLTIHGGPGADGWEIFVDDIRVGTVPLLEAVPLDPGRHRVSFRRSDCDGTSDSVVTVATGGRHELTAPDRCEPPRVCLQPCLSPPPPPWDGEQAPRFGAGAAPLGVIETFDSSERGGAAGGRFELFYQLPVGETLRLRLGGATLASSGSLGSLVAVGPDVEAGARLGRVAIGLGVSGGWAFASYDEPDDASERRPVSSAFVHPYVVPFSLALGDHAEAGSHFGVLLTGQEARKDTKLAPSALSLGLWVRILFGDARRETLYEEP